MKFFKLLLTFILIIGFVLPGCNTDSCEQKPFFEVLGITVEMVQANLTSVQWQDFEGEIDYIATYYGNLNIEKIERKFYSFSLIPSALAEDPICLPDGFNGSEVGIDSLIMVTTYDYNTNYPAGSDVSSIMEFSNLNNEYQSYEAFLIENSSGIPSENQSFRLKEAPEFNNTPLQLSVRLVLENGNSFEWRTVGLNLTL